MKNLQENKLQLTRAEKWAWVVFFGLGINYILLTILLSLR